MVSTATAEVTQRSHVETSVVNFFLHAASNVHIQRAARLSSVLSIGSLTEFPFFSFHGGARKPDVHHRSRCKIYASTIHPTSTWAVSYLGRLGNPGPEVVIWNSPPCSWAHCNGKSYLAVQSMLPNHKYSPRWPRNRLEY